MKAIVILLALSGSALAQIVLPATMLLDGVEYKEVTYKSHDAAKLRFTHSAGMAAVDISKLSPEMQAALDYDAAAAAKAETEQAEQRAATAKAIAEKRAAHSKAIASQDVGRVESVNATTAASLRASIEQAKSRLRILEAEYEESVRGWEKRKVGVNQFGVEYERKSSRNIGGGGSPDSPENKARMRQISALKEYISSSEQKLAGM